MVIIITVFLFWYGIVGSIVNQFGFWTHSLQVVFHAVAEKFSKHVLISSCMEPVPSEAKN